MRTRLTRATALPRTLPPAHSSTRIDFKRDYPSCASCHLSLLHSSGLRESISKRHSKSVPTSSSPHYNPKLLSPSPSLLKSRTKLTLALQLPLWTLVTFGAYLLFKLGYGVFTFNDVPKAHAELMKEIDMARADLRSKGVDVD